MLRLRTATPDDHGIVADIIYRSYSVLMADAYKPEQLAAVLPAITKPNPVLLSSERYFIVHIDEAAVGCGGWRVYPSGGACRPYFGFSSCAA